MKSCLFIPLFFVFLGIIFLLPTSHALTIISDVGDKDGFNGKYDPNTQSFPFGFDFSTVSADAPGEAAFTDRQSFNGTSGISYVHNFTLPQNFTITSVQYEIATFDNAGGVNGGFPGINHRIFLDGGEVRRGNDQIFFFDAVGDLFEGADGSFNDGAAEFFSAELSSDFFTSLLDGQAVIALNGSGGGDTIAVDYSRLIINGTSAVPEPGTCLLFFLAACFHFVRDKRKN